MQHNRSKNASVLHAIGDVITHCRVSSRRLLDEARDTELARALLGGARPRGRLGRRLCAAAGVLACACGADGMDIPETDSPPANEEAYDEVSDPTEEGSTTTGQSQQAVSFVTGDFVWNQGSAAVNMGPTTERFCYLTRIQGDFAGGGESVKIFAQNGNWMLGGSSQQSGIGARARCVPLNFDGRTLVVSGEFSWSQGQAAKQMLVDDGFRACLLTRVQGKFEGGGERVEVKRSNGFWFLTGSSQQSGVAAGARCVSNVLVGAGTKTASIVCSQSCDIIFGCGPLSCFGLATDLGPTQPQPGVFVGCGLGKMSGKFEGAGEFVRVFIGQEGFTDEWRLDAGLRQVGEISTSAFCFL